MILIVICALLFYYLFFFVAIRLINHFKIVKDKKYFIILFAWIVWLIWAIFVKEWLVYIIGDNGFHFVIRIILLITIFNPIHHIAMLFSIYIISKNYEIEDKPQKVFYTIVAFIVLVFAGSYFRELYIKKYDSYPSTHATISDDKLYKERTFYTHSMPFMNWVASSLPTAPGNGSPSTYEFVRLYNNKTGEFLGESNLCSIREYNTHFPSMESMEFSYGWDDIGYFEEIFYGNDVCTIRLKSSQIVK